MDQTTLPAAPLPRVVSRYAVWTWRPWKLWVLGAAPLLLALYALSLGPAVRLVETGWLDSQFVSVAYRPVLFAERRISGPYRRYSSTYLNWWCKRYLRSSVRVRHLYWEVDHGFGYYTGQLPKRPFSSQSMGNHSQAQ